MAISVVRLVSPLQWLKYGYRWHGLRIPKPSTAVARVPSGARATRPDIPPYFTEAYFLAIVVLAWPVASLIRVLHGTSHVFPQALLTAAAWIIVIECLQWILYYLIFRSFIEPHFTLFHPAENLLVFPVVVLAQCATIADLARRPLGATLATLVGDSRLGGPWEPFVADLGRLYLAVAVVALVHSLPPQRARRQRRGIAVIGAGQAALSYVLPALRRVGYGRRAIYLYDIDHAARVRTAAFSPDAPGVRVRSVDTIVEEISQRELPAVIATPTDSHLHYITELGARGVQFAVEKPVCLPGAQRDQLVERPSLNG